MLGNRHVQFLGGWGAVMPSRLPGVEKKATCIYSQVKSCSSSEVAAMIEGILRHCTDAEIQRHFVDTHGHKIM